MGRTTAHMVRVDTANVDPLIGSSSTQARHGPSPDIAHIVDIPIDTPDPAEGAASQRSPSSASKNPASFPDGTCTGSVLFDANNIRNSVRWPRPKPHLLPDVPRLSAAQCVDRVEPCRAIRGVCAGNEGDGKPQRYGDGRRPSRNGRCGIPGHTGQGNDDDS